MSTESKTYLAAMAWLLGACGLVWLFASGCSSTGGGSGGKIVVQPDTVYMGSAGWVISFSPNMPTHPTSNGSGGWYFLFPPLDGVHYVMVPYNALKQHKQLSITYRVSPINGISSFHSVQSGCNEDADFRPMIERQGDTMTADKEFYRWWSAPAVRLVADGQAHTITYALQWSNWTGVFGKSNQAEFNATMNGQIMGVGITFGGGCAAGHGVFGTGKFELLNYQIQ